MRLPAPARLATRVLLATLAVSTASAEAVRRPRGYVERRYETTVRQLLDYTCGAASLATILRHYWGEPLGEADVLDRIRQRYDAAAWRAKQADGMSFDDLARAARIMALNKSYVFFRELPQGSVGPFGVLNVPLIPGRSLAVDPAYHTMGMPIFVSAPALKSVAKGKPFHRLMVAHDVGSAIKGPERGDLYIGSGTRAGKVAGVIKHPASFIVLSPRMPGIETSSTKTSAATRQDRK